MSTQVKKLIPVTLDLGNVVLFDMNPFEDTKMQCPREQREVYLQELTRDNAQLLFSALYALPKTEAGAVEVGKLVELPKASTIIPREKPIPVKKQETRWEKFAKAKGIHKEKRSGKVFDEASGEWKYRHGGKSIKNDSMQGWCEEVNE